jgi:hypothetical protein
VLWQYRDRRDGELKEHRYRPRITVHSVDSKRAFIRFSRPRRNDGARGAAFDGRFLDLRTLAFALTGSGYTLARACRDFGVEYGKDEVSEHGRITPEYVTYCRHDVRATWGLFQALRQEYAAHPIALPMTRAYSTASIGKAYLQAMAVKVPELVAAPDVGFTPDAIRGASMQAYYGGRAEVRIRK